MEIKFKVRINGDVIIMTWDQICESIVFGNVITEDMLNQFTGILDKNGNEIYHHDIVKEYKTLYDWDKADGEESHIEERIHEIVFNNGQFKAEKSDFGWEGEDLVYLNECEIIGCSYYNPEFLNK